MKFRAHAITISLVLVSASAAPAQKRAMTFENFAAIRNVSDPQISPSGTSVLYALRTTDVAKNSRTTVTYLVPTTGGTPRQFPSASVNATEARWSPDGKSVAYVTGGQLWIAAADGSGARQLTKINGGASGPVWRWNAIQPQPGSSPRARSHSGNSAGRAPGASDRKSVV